MDSAPLAGKWGERETSSDPVLKHGAAANAEKEFSALICVVYFSAEIAVLGQPVKLSRGSAIRAERLNLLP